MRDLLIGLVVGLVLGVQVPSASAQPVDPETRAKADAAFTEATAAFGASDFVLAALKFEEAYGLVPDAAYLFNIGEAYRFGKECVKATAAYQKLIELVPDAANVGKAKLHLQEVKVCALFVEGRRLMGAGKPAEACTQFAAAHAEDPGATGTMLNLGLCHEQIGKVATAATWFRRAQNSAVESQATASEAQARARVEALATKIPRLEIVVTPARPGTVVVIDGKPVEAAQLAAFEVDPGRHVIDVQSPGLPSATRAVEVELGAREKVVIALDVPSRGGHRRAAYITGGIGLGLLAGTAVLGFVGRDRYDNASSLDEQNRWKSIVRYGGTSMFVVGCAAVTTSVVLYVRGRGDSRERSAQLAPIVGPIVGDDQLGLSLGGVF